MPPGTSLVLEVSCHPLSTCTGWDLTPLSVNMQAPIKPWLVRPPPLQVRAALELLWNRLCWDGFPCLPGVPAELVLGSARCCGCAHEARGTWQMSIWSNLLPLGALQML